MPNRTPSPRYLDACDDNDGMSFQIELRRRAIIQPRHHGRLIFSFTTNCDNKEVEPAWVILDKIKTKYYVDCVIIINVSVMPIITIILILRGTRESIYSRRCNLLITWGVRKFSYISLGKNNSIYISELTMTLVNIKSYYYFRYEKEKLIATLYTYLLFSYIF